ncbi:PREDICTED: UDP-glucuronosyltransferase 3A1-like [Papilio polytes]|uniref:UDP-glucuronosyltransferase 3A1-like n=1 Tax=Papilio polytes TaxID=76194 RepID=UPI0006765CA2|nr:PREDICTED: UDP-glucuronosyltransferase 3A1-like [Papilio polytes]
MRLASFSTFLIINELCSAYKILLVFPVPGRSHAILGEGYVRHLLNDGHEVTYITPIMMKMEHPRLRQIDISSDFKLMPPDELFDTKNILMNTWNVKNIEFMLFVTTEFVNGTLGHPNVQRLINDTSEQFDAVIVEWLYSELYAGFASVFECPLIWSSSLDPHWLVLDLIDEVPNPAYNPQHLADVVTPLDFWNRAQELWHVIHTKYFKWRLRHRENRIYNNAFASSVALRGRDLPPFNEVRYNGSLMLGNSHLSAGTSISLPPNYIPIGGYHITDNIDPLPSNLQQVADNARNGFIYFSMGSMLKSSRIPDIIKKGLLDVFSKLKQTVIWKFEEDLLDRPKNVHIVSWAPQWSILAHPNCKLFITHGGLLSILETLHFGVPIIGVPMFGDQHMNINRVVEKGFGMRVDLNDDVVVNMEIAIKEILDNPRYTQKVKEYSFVYHDRATSPGKELTHWVSHVIRTKGALHLRSQANMLPWYQKLYLDLAIVMFLIFYLSVKIVFKIFRGILLMSIKCAASKQKVN